MSQRNKGETVKYPGTLQPLLIPPTIWRDISMDFITGLPNSGNKSVIMVVVDHLSKYAHFCALHHPFTTSTVAQIFMDQVFKLHVMPNSIVSNQDPTFTSNFWQELFKLQGTQLHLSSAYHPQTDGQTQVLNKFGNLSEVLCIGKTTPVGSMVTPRRMVVQHYIPYSHSHDSF